MFSDATSRIASATDVVSDTGVNRAAAASRSVLEAQAALERGDAAAIHRAIARAASAQPHHPALPELRARVALLEGRASDAVAALHGDPLRHPHRRLLLNIARAHSGDAAGAEMDLRDWRRQGDAPADADALLAALLIQRGEIETARSVLRDALQRSEHRLCSQLLLACADDQGMDAAARQAAAQLALGLSRGEADAAFLETLELSAPPAAPLEMIDALVTELRESPAVVPTLVTAYRMDPRPQRVELLRRALHRLAEDEQHGAMMTEALAELAEIAGDLDDARRWALKGLRATPYSAKLALLMDRLTRPDADDVRTLEALRRVSAAHPEYNDVRRALILRYHRSGMSDLAARQAERWLLQHPDHPTARSTARELAA